MPRFQSKSPLPKPESSFTLTPKQLSIVELLAGDQRHTALIGGSRSGKTFLLVRMMLIRATRVPYSRHCIFRQRANAARSSIWLDTIPTVVRKCFPQIRLVDHRTDGFIELADYGSEIWIGGLDEKERVDKILGQEFATILFNECSQIAHSSVLTALSRLAQNLPGLKQRAWYDLNPVGKGHWTYQMFIKGRQADGRKELADPDNYKHDFVNPLHNANNLDPEYVKSLANLPERHRRRFYEGIYVDEVEGALWTIEILEKCTCSPEDVPTTLQRVVVAVDPSGTAGVEDKRSDMIGIVVAALGDDGHVYVLADLSLNASPEKWGAEVARAFRKYKADHVTAEINFGGDMVRFVIQTADKRVPVHVVTASRGKAIRAEPVSALYAGDEPRVHHVKSDPNDLLGLEDELTNFSSAGYFGERSPNRADALVWAVTDLMLIGDDGLLATPIIVTARRQSPEDVSQPLPPLLDVDNPRAESWIDFGMMNDITEQRGW